MGDHPIRVDQTYAVSVLVHDTQTEQSLVADPDEGDFPSGGDGEFAHQLGGHRPGRHGDVALLKPRDQSAMLQLEVQPCGKREVRYALGIAEESTDP